MRVHAALEEVFSTRTGLRVLRILVSFPDQAWTGRELAAAATSSPPQTLKALKQLERIGLVGRVTAGRAHVWRLTKEHVLLGPVRSLFSFEAGLPEVFLHELRSALKHLPLRRAALFGSFARRTESSDSDVDLYLELNDSATEEVVQAALSPLVVTFIRRYGVVLSPILYSTRTAREPPNPALMKSIEQEGVQLLGKVG
ncbi:MAG: nucleotidyltransferase domain-containing protein [Thermoplasmata archaeon]|nr:nucleotidyltransferase domain-containing protein [Thermoplasmata archaeon]